MASAINTVAGICGSTPEFIQNESDADRLRRSTTPKAMSVELVSAYAGDRGMTHAEIDLIARQKKKRSGVFYSDLLYSISHIYFPPRQAKLVWNEILIHKRLISGQLGRNIRIIVATLDYLSNIKNELIAPTLIGEAYISKIASLSMRDGMTGLFNHSSFHELLELEFRNHRRYGSGLSLLLLDIDDFKAINDLHGHQEGDRILVELAQTLNEQMRDSDICCRLGGDEFVVILPLTNSLEEAYEIAERITEGVTGITCGGQQIAISIGAALCTQATISPRELIVEADRAMYRAKMAGKKRFDLAVMQ